MKRKYFPYYISRLLLSSIFGVLALGFTWKALILITLFFGLFLLYLHSGWFQVDLTSPLFPLRRDSRGEQIQRKALILSIIVGLITYFALYQINTYIGSALIPGNIAISVAVVAYFTSQGLFFLKT